MNIEGTISSLSSKLLKVLLTVSASSVPHDRLPTMPPNGIKDVSGSSLVT